MRKITYHKVGDVLIPNLTIKDTKKINLGKYGLMRLDYLKEHKKGTYTAMNLQGTLQDHLIEIDNKGRKIEQLIVTQIAKNENINEELKQRNQLQWVGLMNATKNQAEEIIVNELIYT